MKRNVTSAPRQYNSEENPAIRKLLAASDQAADRRVAWLEANKPPVSLPSLPGSLYAELAWLEANKPPVSLPSPPGPLYAVLERTPGSLSPRRALAPNERALQRLTWDYLSGQSVWEPGPNTTWRDYAVEATGCRANECLRHLADLAADGDAKAVEALAATTLALVERLTQLADTRPDALTAFAQRQRHWPVLRSFHSHFDTNDKKSKKLLDRLKVSAGHPLNLYKGKWNPSDDLGKVAVEIYDYLESLRAYRGWAGFARESQNLPLPDFGLETWPQWFAAAKEYILRTYKTPDQVKRLNQLVEAPTRKVPSYKLRTVSKVNSHFFTMLKDKFRSMAGGNRY
jgi:hypothetical protein